MADSPLKPPVPPSLGGSGSAPSSPPSFLQPLQPVSPVSVPTPAAATVSVPASETPEATPPSSLPSTLPPTAPLETVTPQVAAATPPSATPSPSQPQFSSRILQGAMSMSAQPFQDPSANVQKAATPVSVSQSFASSTPAAPYQMSSSGIPSSGKSIPQESSSFSVSPAAGSSTPKAATIGRPNALLEAFKNPKLLIGGAIVLLLVVIGVVAMNIFADRSASSPSDVPGQATNPAAKNVTLTYWGLWEPTEVMQTLIREYETSNPGVKINYVQQKSDQYRARLQTSLRDGSGPDIFRFHNTWMPMIKGDLASAGRNFTTDELQRNYYPIMSRELIQGGQVVGTPLMFEGLALLYNESMLAAAAAQPPRDWEQVRALASQLTVRNGTVLERGGIALGTADNVDNFSDILGLMMLQNSGNPGNPVTPKEQEALTFYTLFSRVDGVWNSTMPNSTMAFANEKAAMIIVPSWRIFEIQQMNPNLKFGVTRVPQLGGAEATWGTYWVEGVSKASKNTEESWKFLAWLSQPEQLRSFHSQAAAVRGFGELSPRVDMASGIKDNPLVAPYLDDALYAQSWYMASMTHDEGLNDKMIQYYTDAVNDMNARGNVEQSLQQVLPGIQQVLSTYGITADAPLSAASP